MIGGPSTKTVTRSNYTKTTAVRASIDIKPLRFAWLVVLCSQIDSAALGFALTAADIVFILTVLSGAVISIESIVKPKLVLVGGDK